MMQNIGPVKLICEEITRDVRADVGLWIDVKSGDRFIIVVGVNGGVAIERLFRPLPPLPPMPPIIVPHPGAPKFEVPPLNAPLDPQPELLSPPEEGPTA
jgi:hypothetical protein